MLHAICPIIWLLDPFGERAPAMCPTETSPEPIVVSPQPQRHRQSPGEERYQQMLALTQAGLPVGTIAKRLGVGARTIQRWLAQEYGPHAGPRKPRRSPSTG
jgi:hypothetical protein